jgi:hypothetical protein
MTWAWAMPRPKFNRWPLLVVLEDFVGRSVQDFQSERLGFDLPSHLESSRTGGISKRVYYNSCLTFHFAPTGNESRRAPSGSRLLRESDQRPQFILAHIDGHLSRLSYRSRAFFAPLEASNGLPLASRHRRIPSFFQHFADFRFFPMPPRFCALRM